MFRVHKEKIGDVSVILCEGRMFGEDAAFKLRDEVKRQWDARIVLLDLSELSALGGKAMRMMTALRTWTRVLGIQFKLFGPSSVMRHNLQRLSPTDGFEIASVDDVLSLLHWEGRLGNRNEQLFRDGGVPMEGQCAVLQ
jgi:anti-anti-sigma regulatory factor